MLEPCGSLVIFSTSSVGAVCGKLRVISHCFIPETKGRTVQARSLASANQETGNPPTVVEWQLQTLSAAIERLTQQNKALMLQNQALEVQIKHPQEHQSLIA